MTDNVMNVVTAKMRTLCMT